MITKSLTTCLATRRRALVLLVVTLCAVGAAANAQAQTFGVRAGVSGDPDQFYGGIHYESRPLADRIRFRPNLEVGVGDDSTLIAINPEFAYKIPMNQRTWGVYVGGGPALNIAHSGDETRAGGGLNFLVGLEHHAGLFAELKVGALDSPGVKFTVGYVLK